MRFQLTVYRDPHGVSELSLDAADLPAARQQAEAQGFKIIAAKTHAMGKGFGLTGFAHLGGERFAVPLFCQELLALLEAGMGLVESLSILARKAKQDDARRILNELQRLVGEGRSFSRALEGIPTVFPALFIATVKSAERTGNINEALKRYLAYHRQLNAVRDKMLAAAVYPVLLVGVGMLVVFFLLTYVVPRFSKIYDDIGREHLPLLSRWLMQWGQWVSENALIFGGFVIGVSSMLIYGLTRPGLRIWVARKLWQLPVVGEQLRIYQLARFTRTVAMLQKGGVPLVTALDMTDDLLRQPALREGLMAAKTAIREGRAVSDAFGQYGLTTEVGTRLLIVGERSGELGEIMERIASFYDEEIARSVEWASRLFEPLLMVFIGLLIGGIVILMYMPIFELASSLQ
jgi:general secretion pathway protein F